jgi:Type II secretion system (T2SS), protein N
MKRLALLALLAAGFVGGLIAFAPLSTALSASGATARGLGWSSAEGTVLSGTVRGLTLNGKAYGDADLAFAPGGLLSAALQYTVDWAGPQGSGQGKLAVGPGGRVSLRDYTLSLDLAQLDQAALWIRQSGGRVDLTGAALRFGPEGCIAAEGMARSDVLERNREILGPGWSPMQGALRCEGGTLIIPLASENQTGTRFNAGLRLAPRERGQFEARVSGIVPRELAFALPIAGFAPQGQDYVYLFQTSDTSAPQ